MSTSRDRLDAAANIVPMTVCSLCAPWPAKEVVERQISRAANRDWFESGLGLNPDLISAQLPKLRAD